jgi:hypothetical protein
VPLAVDRRGGRCGDDLGVGQGLRDGGVALLATDDGDEELLRLDDLEVR